MKIFDKDRKINFVDDNNVFVGFDNNQSCCEQFGWALTSKIPKKQPDEGENGLNPDGFQFDTAFFMESVLDVADQDDVVFRLTCGYEEMYLILWNCHNGYYSHGFEMYDGHKLLHEGSL